MVLGTAGMSEAEREEWIGRRPRLLGTNHGGGGSGAFRAGREIMVLSVSAKFGAKPGSGASEELFLGQRKWKSGR